MSQQLGSTPRDPVDRVEQDRPDAPSAMTKTLTSRRRRTRAWRTGISAGGGIARRNSITGVGGVARGAGAEQRRPSATPTRRRSRSRRTSAPGWGPGRCPPGRRATSSANALRISSAAGRRSSALPAEQPTRRERHQRRRRGRARAPSRADAAVHSESPRRRCDGCHCSTRRSTAAKTTLSTQPSRPVAMINAYMSSTLPPGRATSIDCPSPGVPTTSSAVTDEDEGDRRGDPQAGGDVGHRARQGDRSSAAAGGARSAGGVRRHRVDVLTP